MPRPLTKRDIDILEERGLWEASSWLHRIIKKLIRRRAPLEVRYIKQAHRTLFTVANQVSMAGKFRQDNPELKRVNGTLLRISHWHRIPSDMAELDTELRAWTNNLKLPKTAREYDELLALATVLSHRLAVIHPFENGNGRMSRLLLNAILLRAGLPEIAIKKPKPRYLRALRQADDGDFGPLKTLIADGLLEVQQKTYQIRLRKQAELAQRKRHQHTRN